MKMEERRQHASRRIGEACAAPRATGCCSTVIEKPSPIGRKNRERSETYFASSSNSGFYAQRWCGDSPMYLYIRHDYQPNDPRRHILPRHFLKADAIGKKIISREISCVLAILMTRPTRGRLDGMTARRDGTAKQLNVATLRRVRRHDRPSPSACSKG